ncbi:polyprotein [Tall oatgrass mosaic virus]|uniref:Genome polyprotein n=1 Tax=Tall oatgrass mosaic virus TaxID=1414644 RepID=U5TQA1_9POTY|nr:polyprotein [Tall oatgrass mosaic virus]AGZ02786.1 polyprotein [Tall oatgrass mosaic virus]
MSTSRNGRKMEWRPVVRKDPTGDTCPLKGMGESGVVDNDPYVQCEARTRVYFQTEEEVDVMVNHHGHGSIFWSSEGVLTQTAKNLYIARAHGLAYDLAADVFICTQCSSSCANYRYFTEDHEACSFLVSQSVAYIKHNKSTKVVEAFPIMPVYATKTQEAYILQWMEKTSRCLEGHCYVKQDEIKIFNQKTGMNEVRERTIISPVVVDEPEVVQSRTVYVKHSSPVQTYKEKKIKMRSKDIQNLVDSVAKMCQKKGKAFEVVDAKGKHNYPKIPLKHTMGYPKSEWNAKKDIPEDMRSFVETYKDVATPVRRIDEINITYGWSGTVFSAQDLPEKYADRCVDGLFIVLGRCECGDLQNALNVECTKGLKWCGGYEGNPLVPRMHEKCILDHKAFSGIETHVEIEILKALLDIYDMRCRLCVKEWKARSETDHEKILKNTVSDFLSRNPSKNFLVFKRFIDSCTNGGTQERQLKPSVDFQLVDVWRTMQHTVNIPNRKLYMGMFSDPYGNFDFFPNTSLPRMFLDYVQPVRYRLAKDGSVVTNYRFVDKNNNIETCIESLYAKFDHKYWSSITKAVHKLQPIHECKMDISGEAKVVCHWEGDIPLYNTIIRATPSHLSFGLYDKLLYINDSYGADMYVPKNGYCYLYIFACAMSSCDNANRTNVDEFVNQVCEELGPWPKFKQVLRKLDHMATYYGCYDAPVPTILVDHHNHTMHVPSPFGIKQSGMHTLRMNTLGHLIRLDTMAEGPMRDYEIGGIDATVKGISASVKSRKEFIRRMTEDAEWFVDMMISPSTFFVLGGLLELLHILLEDVEYSLDKIAAILNIKQAAFKLGPHLDSARRVRAYIELMIQHRASVECIVPSNNMKAEILNHVDQLQRAILDEQKILVMDRVDGKKKMLVEQDLLRAECTYNEFFSSIGFLSFHGTVLRLTYSGPGRRVGEMLESLRSNWLTRYLRAPHMPADAKKNTLKTLSTIGNICDITYKRVFSCLVANALQVVIIGLATIFGTIVLKKILKMLKWEMKQRDPNEVEYQGKREEAWISKVMAMMYIVATFFSVDFSSAIYSNLVKFRTIFDILKVNCEYQGVLLDKLSSHLGDIPTFHEIVLYDHEATVAHVPPTLQTFEMWFDSRVQSGQCGVSPLEGKHTKYTMDKTTVGTVASKIHADASKEFLVEGHVGCGKSTAFPAELSKNGRVLICEPTRVLVTNLQDSMQATRNLSISGRMRNYINITASNITVTTYGYALHWLYNQPDQLDQFSYILFDEVHQRSGELDVFYNWLKSTAWNGKIVKLTATPNNVSSTMQTQVPIDIGTWPNMSHHAFMKEQGAGTTHDATKLGKVIIVFLTSFREIDESAEILAGKGNIGYIKADSRHLRNKVNLMEEVEAMKQEYKYILATNILQNGVNIHADVVVDFGYKIVPSIDSDMRMLGTKRQLINKADRIQRLGRIGRMKAGYARKIGTDIDSSFEVDPVTATEGALLAFGLGVAPIINNVDVLTFGKVTQQQVKTASRFEMQLAYMVWMVNKDGTMAVSLHEQFKELLLTPGNMHLSPYYTSLDDVHRFKSIGDYVKMSYMKTDIDHELVLPFHSRDISVEFAKRIGRAYKESIMPTSVKLRVPAVNYREVSMKLAANPGNLGIVLYMVEEALVAEKNKLQSLTDGLQQFKTNYCSFLTPNFSVEDKLSQAIKKIQTNVQRLEGHKNRLELAVVEYDHDKLMALLQENPSVAAHVEYQAGPKCFIDDILLEKRRYGWMPYVAIGTACTIAGTAWLVMYYKRMKAKSSYEGKAARNKKNKRQSGYDEKMERESRYTYNDSGDVLYDGVNEWNNSTNDWASQIKKKKNAHSMQFGQERAERVNRPQQRFWHFYGFDPAMYDTVEFKDIASGFAVNQSASDIDLVDAFDQMVAFRRDETNEDQFYGETAPREVKAAFRRGGATREVMMTPHKPNKINARGLPVGYADKRGQWRQAVQSEEAEANFENKSLYESPRSLDCIHQNQVILVGNSQLNGLIVGNILFAPYHFTRGIGEKGPEERAKMYTRFASFDLGYLTQKVVHKFHMMDLVALILPPSFQPRRKLKNFRIPVNGERAILVTTEYKDNEWTNKHSAESPIVPYGDKHDGLWKHKISTSLGDCGSVLVAVSDDKIVGFHNLGGKGENYFTPVTQEVLDFLQEKAEKALVPWRFSDEQVDLCGLIVQNDASIFPFSKIIKDLANWQSLNMPKYCGENFKAIAYAQNHMSKRHVITGKRPEFIRFLDSRPKWWSLVEPLQDAYAPSVLNHEAYYKDILKYNKDIMVGTVNEICFANAVISTIEILKIAGFKERECKVIYSGARIYNDLNLDAAMGALYTGKKSEYFMQVSDEEIEDFFTQSAAKLCSNGHGVWSGLLKAELRPKAKVDANKTRTFTSAPADILMGAKAVVDEFNKKFYTQHLKGPWTVGINKFNRGWDLLAKNLQEHEWYIDADGSQFDSSITPLLMNAVLNIRLYFLEEDNVGETMLKNLYTQIINTCILIEDGTIVQKYRGNNSGQPSTVVDNTMCLIIAMEYCRERVRMEHGIDMTMLYVCNGDDLLINANSIDKDLTQQHFARYMKELELNYSFEDAYKSIEEIEYMSHTFMKKDNVYIPKLKKNRIIAILEWQRSKEPKAIQSAIIAAYVEAFGYEDMTEMIEELAQQMNTVWEDFKLPAREEVAALYLTGSRTDIQEELKAVSDRCCMYEYGVVDGLGTSKWCRYEAAPANQDAILDAALKDGQSSGGDENLNVGVRPIVPPNPSDNNGTGSFIVNPVKQTGKRTDDVKDRSPGLMFPQPKREGKAIYVPRPIRNLLRAEQLEKMIAYQPRAEQIDNRYASEKQVQDWMKGASDELGVSEENFVNILLPGWIYHCIINTCSPGNNSTGTWRVVNNIGQDDGAQIEYSLKPMYKHAYPSLRQVMRHFEDAARVMIEKSFELHRPIIPRAHEKAGVVSIDDVLSSVDFIMFKAGDSARTIQVRNNVAVNRLKNVKDRLFAQARLSAGMNEDISRHDADDVQVNTHTFRGADVMS